MSKSKFHAAFLAATLLLGVTLQARATTLAADDFGIADGALAGTSSGTGWSGAWTGGGNVAGGVVSTLGSRVRALRELATPIVPVAGLGIYVGLQFGANGDQDDDWAGLSFLRSASEGGGERLFIGMAFNTDAYGLDITQRRAVASTTPVDAALHRLIAQILFSAANSFTVNLYIDPTGALGVPAASYSGTFAPGSWGEIRLASGDGAGTIGRFDNLVIGTTLEDIGIPEPSSLALAGLGLAAMFARRRRHPQA